MIVIENQKLSCKICQREVRKEDAIFIDNIAANENDPLAVFNDAILDKACFDSHPLRPLLLKRYEELDRLKDKNKTDYITGEALSIENTGHADNVVNVFYLTDDQNAPLYQFNGIALNKSNLSKWNGMMRFSSC